MPVLCMWLKISGKYVCIYHMYKAICVDSPKAEIRATNVYKVQDIKTACMEEWRKLMSE